MSYKYILVEREDGVGIITLNRPDVLNAMNRKLGAELLEAVNALDGDDGIGCLVVTGAGEKAFSAGGDIKEQLSDDKRYSREEQDRMGHPRRSLVIASCNKPIIGMMNGLAYGGGQLSGAAAGADAGHLGVVAIDGKALRHSFDAFNDQKAAHVLSAFSVDDALILGHLEVDEKSNEIPAAQGLIKALALEGRLYTMDAMHCQKNF